MTFTVAVISESVSPERGGAETSTAQFARRLVDRGLAVHLYTSSEVNPAEGLRVHNVSVDGLPKALRTVAFSRRVDHMLTDHSYDIVHAITPCMKADVYQPRGGTLLESIARNLAIRKSKTSRALKRLTNRFNVKQRAMLRLERCLLDRKPAVAIAALSDYVKEQLIRHYGTNPASIHKIFNGVDYESCSEEQRQQNRIVIRKAFGLAKNDVLTLLIAHNFKLKGVAQWLYALKVLNQRLPGKIKSIIIGRANPLPFIRLSKSLNLQTQVTFSGPSDRITAFLHAADILVHPTYYDPCSRVVLESMLHGLPCVTTKYNGAAEVIEDGVNGRVIDSPEHTGELAEAVEQIIDGRYRDALIAEHDVLAERLSMKRHVAETIELYQTLKKKATVS